MPAIVTFFCKNKFVIIDTEDFKKLVGINKGLKAKSYADWYFQLLKKAIKIKFFRNKQERIYDQIYVN